MTSGTQKHSSRATTKTQCMLSLPAARAWTVTGCGAVSVDCGVFTVPPTIGYRPTPPNWRVLRTASCPAILAGLIAVRSTRAQHRGAALVAAGDVFPQQALRTHHQDNGHQD